MVWALVVLHGLLLVIASVLYPTYRAPDESAHVDMVLLLAQGGSYPGVGERQLSQRMLNSHPLVGHDRTGERTPLEADDALPRGERPTFPELGPDVPSDVPQQMGAHPPLYYRAGAAVLSVARALVPGASAWSFDQVVGFLRLFGAALVLPLPLLAYLAAQRLDLAEPVAVAAAVLPVGIPQLTHIGASVNNDTLLVVLLAGLTVPTLRAAGGDTSLPTALFAGVLSGLALLTKGFALFVPGWLVFAYAVGALRGRPRAALGAGGVAVGTATALGGWWWIRNLLTFGTVQPAGLPSPPTPEGFVPEVASWLPFYIQRMSVRFWIEPNILPDGLPRVDLLATLLLAVCCVAALVAAFVADGAARRRVADLGVLLAPLAGLLAIVTFGAWRVYARTGTAFAIHGRYLYGGLVGLAVVVALGAAALLRTRERWLSPTALAAAVTAQLAAGGLALAEYWGPAGQARPGQRVAALLAWSPWPAAVLVAAVGAAGALTIWVGLVLIRKETAQGTDAPGR